MNISQESIFSSALRSFFTATFAIFGIFAGIIPVLILIGAFISSAGELAPTSVSTILPDDEGHRTLLPETSPVILQIDVQGIIGSRKLDSEIIRKQLQSSQEGNLKDGRIKGILLSINSPGGTVVDSDGIYRTIKDYKEKYHIPVFAFIDGICASGGMYVASSADKIYTSNISLVGSIGVMMQFMNLSQTLEKIGIESRTLIAGKNKDSMNPLRPWGKGEEQSYQKLISFFYERFVNIVTESRPKIDKELLIKEYGAQVFSAKEALDFGFIDESNYERSDALKALAKEAGIQDEKYQVVQIQTGHWLHDFIESRSPLITGKLSHDLQIGPNLEEHITNQFMYLYTP